MAKVFPDGWRELAAAGSAGRELQTLGQLAAGLDDQYTVYHGVHWTRVDRSNFAIVGEIDFAVLGPTGDVLPAKDKIHRFPGDILELVPEVHAVVVAAGALYTRLSGGGLPSGRARSSASRFACA